MDEARTTAGPLLDARKAPPRVDLIEAVLAARRAGKGFLAQVLEMRRLARGPGRLRPLEYYLFGLYDDRRFTAEAKRTFVGERGQVAIFRRLCDATWFAPAHDKLLHAAILRGLGFATPRMLGLYHPFRRHEGAEALRAPADVAAFLRRAGYPMFGKPVTGKYSVGTVLLAGYDGTTDTLTAAGGRTATVEAFVAELAPHRSDGYLFQERLRPHPDVAELVGDRLATVRVVVLLDATGPTVLRALWKMPVGPHVADNFWRAGNLLCALDAETGTVTRAVRGVAHRQAIVTAHPDTGTTLVGARVPDWGRLIALCLAAAAAFPGLRLQAWDVAPLADGPLLLELNVGGDMNLSQHAYGEGMYDDRLRAAVAGARASA
jgi:hypothetical protein